MLTLLISGQDIRELSLGLVRDGRLAEDLVAAASPEHYLATIVAALAGWNVRVEDLDAIAVVTGPGSFTSSRVSTTIANAIAFGRNVPVVGLENAARKNLHEIAESLDLSSLPPTDRFAIPVYDRPPHITSSGTKILKTKF